MKRLRSSSALGDASAWAPAESGARGPMMFSAAAESSQLSVWILAAAGLVFAVVAANLLCLSPRWYSNRFIALVYEPARFVVLTAATGATGIQIFWELLNRVPAAGRMQVARSFCGAWVFLPCLVLLYEQDSLWILAMAALVGLGTAFGLRRLLPPAENAETAMEPTFRAMPSLDGLPPADSPLLLAFWCALFAQAAFFCAVGGALLPAAYATFFGVLLLAFRWSAIHPRAVEWWIGAHPPLRQGVAAVVLTSLTLVPFAIGGNMGIFGLRGNATKKSTPPKHPAEASSGYYGIILYPPPHKKEIVAPMPHDASFEAGAMTKPMLIPFDGEYWYFKAPNRRPGEKAHIAHGKPVDANVNPRSTDGAPLQMEAHQRLSQPVDVALCGEMDVAVTNADTRPGEISLMATLWNSKDAGKPVAMLGLQSIASSMQDVIPADRSPVKEVLHFRIPKSRTLQQFDEITIHVVPAQRRSRLGAKVSIDSFELLPR